LNSLSNRQAEDPFDSDAAFPRLGEEVVSVLEAAGERRPLATGEILYRAGDPASTETGASQREWTTTSASLSSPTR
jgi:hypothetical protein